MSEGGSAEKDLLINDGNFLARFLELQKQQNHEESQASSKKRVAETVSSEAPSSKRPALSSESPKSDKTLPTDVRFVIDTFAEFVVRNGENFASLASERNKGNPKFNFLLDTDSAEHQYYLHRLAQLRRDDSRAAHNSRKASGWDSCQEMEGHYRRAVAASASARANGTSLPATADSKPQPTGHHIGDFLPKQELERFLKKEAELMGKIFSPKGKESTDSSAREGSLDASNRGHQLLQKMGWSEGAGLGSGASGMKEPVQAGPPRTGTVGIGAEPANPDKEEDIYELYKKRMMLSYRYRPNPMGNPRNQYY
mmetsp:Transcript_41361/g.104302  ORF Transcript_41361/g.104302 Transcript_41361/m.104302 type:complete len:311 (+) Transcript_41361:210-1142(+)|eukprot:CAMPEP_0177631304 /NCGR_PEP_ID=MMETSP0447-20121125/1676_1 /TAXON_ID=0 /ORGANISM="Stygamoeba regulata, Strain BSH-02190019" /LENGTH=310 /DNA_ID=CAMNT_0019132775 /DNA_START=183 /DNA_END=1115 /DNA_ORIENTATION=-